MMLNTAVTTAPEAEVKKNSQAAAIFRRFAKNKLAVVGLYVHFKGIVGIIYPWIGEASLCNIYFHLNRYGGYIEKITLYHNRSSFPFIAVPSA